MPSDCAFIIFFSDDSFCSHSEQKQEDASSDTVNILIKVGLEAACSRCRSPWACVLTVMSACPSNTLEKQGFLSNSPLRISCKEFLFSCRLCLYIKLLPFSCVLQRQ